MTTKSSPFDLNITESVVKNFRVKPLRRLEDRLLQQGAFEGSEKDWVRRGWRRNLTPFIPNTLRTGYELDGNSSAVIMGPPGDGKSVSARSLALFQQGLIKEIKGIDVKIHLAFSNPEAFRLIRKMKKGDILLRDENPNVSGEGAATIRSALMNVQANVRANLNSFFFVSPAERGYTNLTDLLLETFGINTKDYGGLNRVKIYAPKREIVLGWAIIPRIIDPVFEAYYQERKNAHIDKLIDDAGLTSGNYDRQRIKQQALQLLQETKKEFPEVDLKRKHFSAIITTINVPGSTRYQSNVITWAEALLDYEDQLLERVQTQKVEKKAVSLKGIEFDKDLFDAFQVAMQRFIKAHVEYDASKTPHNISAQCADIYPYYLQGMPPKTIRKLLDYDLPKVAVERRIERLDEFLDRKNGHINEKVGKLYEDVFCAYYRAQGHDVIQGGGSKAGGIDAIVNGQAWSLKCYHNNDDDTIKVYWKDVSRGEKKYAQEHNTPLGISLLNAFWLKVLQTEIPIGKLKSRGFVSFSKFDT